MAKAVKNKPTTPKPDRTEVIPPKTDRIVSTCCPDSRLSGQITKAPHQGSMDDENFAILDKDGKTWRRVYCCPFCKRNI